MIKSLFHWRVLANFLLAMGIFVGLVWLTFRWLEIHTKHGKEVAVPNVMNKSVYDAIKILDDSGLQYEVDSFKYDPRFKPFQVLQVYPSPGSHVKDGRTVELKVNPRSWAPISVPDILDKYKGLAFRRLDLVGLKVGDTLYEPSIQRDAIIRMTYNGNTLKPGTLLPRFSTIDLVIGSGPMRNIQVPNVVGLTVQEAKAIISQNLFEIGLIEHEDGGKDDADIIYYQDPSANDARDQGMQIDLWASKKIPAQMGAKIDELNSIYRIKIDTTLPPVHYEEVPVYKEEVPKPPKQTTETKAPEVKTKLQTISSKVEKPKTENTTTKVVKTVTAAAVSEKAKAKKVVVE